MKVLHICDHPPFGGAFVASQSVVDLVGGSVFRNQKPSAWVQAWATIGGYCLRSEKKRVTSLIRAHNPDIVHLHNFKEFGTAAIASAKQEGVPAIWSCYDYWPLCPRDNFHGPDCAVDRCRISCYNPRDRRLPVLSKLPLLGRKRRITRWMNELDGIIALSSAAETILIEGGIGVPDAEKNQKTHIIPLPITLPEAIEVERNENLVAFVGGNPKNKGRSVFFEVEALVRKKRPAAEFHEIKADSRLGALKAIATAKVLVVPELWPNPGPVVVVEAALLGTKVVATDVGGIRETTERYSEAGFAQTNDAMLFANEIVRCLDAKTDPRPGPDLPKSKEQLLEVYECAVRRA